jgi:hypothetical protein
MQAEHFLDWFCATHYCPYSKSSQIVAKAEEQSILRAQAAGKAVAEGAEGAEGADLANGDGKFTLNTPRRPDTRLCPLLIRSKRGTENEASSEADWGDEMELENEDDETDADPRTHGYVQHNRSKQADNALAALGPDITKQVDKFLIQVASDTAGDVSKKWYKAEEELLWLLRAHRVRHYTISTVSADPFNYVPLHLSRINNSSFPSRYS